MAKRGSRKVVNNIDEVNIQIDYDKLADSIVKAQNRAREKSNPPMNLRFRAMRFINGVIYISICVSAVFGIYVVWKEHYTVASMPLYGCILLTILLIFVIIYAFLCQQESFNDNTDDSATHFNTNIALIALIVALIALMKGVA